jgi:hypothetical protein
VRSVILIVRRKRSGIEYDDPSQNWMDVDRHLRHRSDYSYSYEWRTRVPAGLRCWRDDRWSNALARIIPDSILQRFTAFQHSNSAVLPCGYPVFGMAPTKTFAMTEFRSQTSSQIIGPSWGGPRQLPSSMSLTVNVGQFWRQSSCAHSFRF